MAITYCSLSPARMSFSITRMKNLIINFNWIKERNERFNISHICCQKSIKSPGRTSNTAENCPETVRPSTACDPSPLRLIRQEQHGMMRFNYAPQLKCNSILIFQRFDMWILLGKSKFQCQVSHSTTVQKSSFCRAWRPVFDLEVICTEKENAIHSFWNLIYSRLSTLFIIFHNQETE